MKLLRWVLASILTGSCLFALPSCQSAPEYEVSSYEQIKTDLADQPDIIFPDISKYEKSGVLKYFVNLYQGDRRIRNGYTVVSYDDIPDPYAIDTLFKRIAISCLSLKYYKDERNLAEELDCNTTYRDVAMEFAETDFTENINDLGLDNPYPDGSKFGGLGARFDLNGYRYLIEVHVLLTPDEQKTTTYEQRMADAREELFVIVDDILDKGGLPR
jgi:hypothetical protein